MLGIYLSIDLYNEIKATASTLNKSMKDYLIDLHKATMHTSDSGTPSEQYNELQKQLQIIHQKLDVLAQYHVATSSSNAQRTRVTQKSRDKPITTKTPAFTSSKSYTTYLSDLQNIPLVVEFLDQFQSQPRQRQSLLDTIAVLYAHGGQATSSIIKRERNLVRTTVAHKQIAVLVASGVVVENTAVSPRVVKFTSLWMEQLGLSSQ